MDRKQALVYDRVLILQPEKTELINSHLSILRMLGHTILTAVFANKYRINILQILNDQPSTLTNLTKRLGSISNSEVSRHLSIMAEHGLVQKESFAGRKYVLTPQGRTLLSLFAPLMFISKYEEYFSHHTLEELPNNLLHSLDRLMDAHLIAGTGEVMSLTQECFRKAEDSIYLMSENRFPFNTEQPLNACIIAPPEFKSCTSKPQHTQIKFRKAMVRTLPKFTISLVIIDQNEALLAFPKVGELTTDFSTTFHITDAYGLKFCVELWEYYWRSAKPA